MHAAGHMISILFDNTMISIWLHALMKSQQLCIEAKLMKYSVIKIIFGHIKLEHCII